MASPCTSALVCRFILRVAGDAAILGMRCRRMSEVEVQDPCFSILNLQRGNSESHVFRAFKIARVTARCAINTTLAAAECVVHNFKLPRSSALCRFAIIIHSTSSYASGHDMYGRARFWTPSLAAVRRSPASNMRALACMVPIKANASCVKGCGVHHARRTTKCEGHLRELLHSEREGLCHKCWLIGTK